MDNKTKSRSYLLGIFAVFFGPLFFAMWLFYGPNDWLSSSKQNHGTLIQPAQPLEEFTLTSVDGNAWDQAQFSGKWTLLYLGDEVCDLYCEASLFKMRQVRLSLGRYSERIQCKYLGIHKDQSLHAIEQIFAKYPRMQVGWFKKTIVDDAIPKISNLPMHQIYLIDPLGNLMMWYPKEATSKGIKKDLKRLLKVSKIG